MSFNILTALPVIGKLFESTTEIIKEVVTDKDQQNQIIGNLKEIELHLYSLELQTKTVPWVDSLHKMGRQITNWLTIIAVTTPLILEIEITGPAALILGGGNVAYQIIKGKGK